MGVEDAPYHGVGRCPRVRGSRGHRRASHVPFLKRSGIGVDIFFGLSGFLITYLLLRERERFGRIDIGKFWLRRLLRLLPALLVMVVAVDMLALASLINGLRDYLVSSLAATPGVLLYFGNWPIVATSSPELGWFAPMWSLAVEEQFYLIWPLIVIAAMRTNAGIRALAWIVGLIVAATATARFSTFDGTNM